MKTKISIVIVLGVLFISQSCDKQNSEPYIIFKDNNAQVITKDTIEVASTSIQELLVETGFKGSTPTYLRQINNDEIIDISDSTDVTLLSHGFADLDFEKVVITTNIIDLHVTNGTIIKTTVRLGTDLSKSIYYKIQ